MANLPDLRGEVLGMVKTELDDPGFNSDQPWYVRFRVTNAGSAPAPPYSVKLATLNGRDIETGVLCWTSQKLLPMNPGSTNASDFHLPPGISQPDFGVKHAFVFTIDWKGDVHEGAAFSEAESNNIIVWAKAQGPPVLPKATEPPPPPPSPWDLMKATALVGKKDVLVARVHNRSRARTRAATLQLHLHVPTPGAPAGIPELVGSAPIPQIPPGKTRSVTITASRAFLLPRADGKAARTAPSRTPVETSAFTPLVRFSLSVKGSGVELGFGTSPVGGGTIKIPGKT